MFVGTLRVTSRAGDLAKISLVNFLGLAELAWLAFHHHPAFVPPNAADAVEPFRSLKPINHPDIPVFAGPNPAAASRSIGTESCIPKKINARSTTPLANP